MNALLSLIGWAAAIFFAIVTGVAAGHGEYLVALITAFIAVASLFLTGSKKESKGKKKAKANADAWW